jgi:hypothetical protein
MEELQEVLTDYAEDGVDLTLIRSFLALTPRERLDYADECVTFVREVWRLNSGK